MGNLNSSVSVSPAKRWLRIEEAAQYSKTTPGFIRAQIRGGTLLAARAGNRYVIDRNDIDAFLEHLKEQVR